MTINQVQNDDGTSSFVDADTSREVAILRPGQGFDPGLATYVRLFDDFQGDVIADQWSAAQGSDGQGAVAAIVAGEHGGVVRLTSGDAGTGTAADGSVLTHALNWKASAGGLYMRARLRINTSVASVCVNVGFTDVLATTTLEMPITISGTTLTTNASDAAVFVFDTAQTNDYWHTQGVKANSDTAIANTEVAPVADTYTTLEIFIDTSGTATFYIDGVLEGQVANAVTAATALTPVVAVETRTTAVKVVDVDYIEVCALRA